MNILQITPYFPPAWSFGGPVRHVHEISKYLVKQGHKITVFTTNKLSPFTFSDHFFEIMDGINIYRFPVYLNYKGYWITPLLNRYLFKIKPDIIHIHSFRNYQCDISYLYCKIRKKPFILTAHGSIRGEEEQKPNFNFYQIIRKMYDTILGKRIIRDAARLIAVNSSEIWHYSSLGAKKEKISLIPNGVNTELFEKNPEKEQIFREKLNIDEKFILSVGRLDYIKGFDFLIKGFNQIIKEYTNLKLIIIGQDFGHKKKLLNLVQKLKLDKSIIFIETLFKDLLVGAYSAASIYVQPSRFEVFGMAAMEAAACETPLVVTNVGAFRNIMSNEKNGFIVNFNDLEKFTDICLNLLQNEKFSKEIGKNSRNFIKEFYNWNAIGENIENNYKKVLENYHT